MGDTAVICLYYNAKAVEPWPGYSIVEVTRFTQSIRPNAEK